MKLYDFWRMRNMYKEKCMKIKCSTLNISCILCSICWVIWRITSMIKGNQILFRGVWTERMCHFLNKMWRTQS